MLKPNLFYAIAMMALVMLITAGCLTDSPTREYPLEGRIFFNVEQDGIRVSIRLYTEKDYPCANYELVTGFIRYGNKLIIIPKKVDLNGIVCLDAFGSANTLFKFNNICDKLFLYFKYGGRHYNFVVENKDSLIITGDTTGLIVPVYKDYYSF